MKTEIRIFHPLMTSIKPELEHDRSGSGFIFSGISCFSFIIDLIRTTLPIPLRRCGEGSSRLKLIKFTQKY